ncbi:Tudor-knot domain-containing protein [[Phormidium] sp. ETS-05]|uniref:Tudor-knot domain-containing protein n=1 Tax=[Phormidium] sp. ETS-05 TaxID=222819 RepID=UPI0018EEFB0D|nr:Tudor-knot domain-containing protein [[Phormidium] sp. ETS-05]
MGKSIIQLVDELPADNITVKVLKALDYLAPGEWNNLVGFDNTIRAVTGETDPKVIQRLRDRAVSLYFDPKKGYEAAVTVYQTIDKADAAMGAAAMANKIGEKISFLSFLGNITPKADVTQTIDLLLKIAVEIIAFCKLNGIPQPNPQQFAAALANNYQDAALMRMVALVCIDGLLPLGPDFLSKIQTIISGTDPNTVAANPVFSAVSSSLPGNSTSDKFGFITQAFSSVQGWMNGLVAKTGLTPQSIFNSVGKFIQVADDNLDFVAAFLDQTTNYYEHTGIQTVARRVILDAYDAVKAEMQQEGATSSPSSSASGTSETGSYTVGQTVEVWDGEDEDWYQATIQKVKAKEYYVHYVGYGSSDDEWVDEDDVRSRDFATTDDNGYAVGQKVKIWDDDEEEWYSAIIKEIRRKQYYIHYIGYDDSDDEWVDSDDIS